MYLDFTLQTLRDLLASDQELKVLKLTPDAYWRRSPQGLLGWVRCPFTIPKRHVGGWSGHIWVEGADEFPDNWRERLIKAIDDGDLVLHMHHNGGLPESYSLKVRRGNIPWRVAATYDSPGFDPGWATI